MFELFQEGDTALALAVVVLGCLAAWAWRVRKEDTFAGWQFFDDDDEEEE